MKAHGFQPVVAIGKSQALIIANRPKSEAKRPAMRRLINQVVYGQPTIMDVNRLTLAMA